MRKSPKRSRLPKANEALRDFLKENEIFADLFNTCVFGGKEILHNSDFEKVDTTLSESIECNEELLKVRRYRDIARKATLNAKYVILGVENQSKVHYAMPLRIMLYDALGYTDGCKDQGALHNSDKWTADEYLSRVSKGIRLIPIFTLVLYTGERKWDGPRSLYDMLELDEEMKPYISDYHMNLIDVGHDEMRNFRTTKLKELFYAMRCIYNGKAVCDKTRISGSVLSLTGILTGSYTLYHTGEGEKIEMCKALDQIEQRGIEKGKAEGKVEGKAEGKAEGLGALVRSLHVFLPEFEALYQAIIKNAEYADVSREQVRAFYESIA